MQLQFIQLIEQKHANVNKSIDEIVQLQQMITSILNIEQALWVTCSDNVWETEDFKLYTKSSVEIRW